MGITDGYIQATPGGGKKADTSELTVSAQTVERERATITDPLNTMEQLFTETFDYGLLLRGIYNREVANAFWLLADEIHSLRVVMEEADL